MDPEVRKIASRILKKMGVKSEGQIPDAQKELSNEPTKTLEQDRWVGRRGEKCRAPRHLRAHPRCMCLKGLR